ncbi:arginine-tRNA-protein transferase [Zychaea mexicana]|uniref:arginine-tRNA-protein transferase n=1 Tax=Zychaea mexicana TaxID=64656 RepID=UPI0022FDD558|nr:arginine-tRNA-protein transferase [Zychaea mexicana]KAI9489250.1 arginine-tRNA-protein transferase [Zychaea mexicana]
MSRISLTGRSNHSCGYCHSDGDTSYTYGMWAHALTCADYQALIDRGWRRSGQYLYKPDLSKSCCPQYTIRLDANGFKPSKGHRKVINKFNRFVEGSWKPTKEDEMDKDGKQQHLSKVNYDTKKSLIENINLVEKDKEPTEHPYEHKFEVVLEPSSVTKEKFELYRKYQVHIHHDEFDDVSERSFKRFLVDSPLKLERFPDNKPGQGYGSFHQKYILDGKLIAVAVLDVLPKCTSSVYFLYDPDYSFLGLGKYSALREISLAQELSQSVSNELHWYYMGFYIHSCPKMNYKGGYQPSDLLDAETYQWYPINECTKLLDKKKFAVFSEPDKEWNGQQQGDEEDRIPGTLHKSKVKARDVDNTHVLLKKTQTAPVSALVGWYDSSEFRDIILEYIAVVGPDLTKRLVIDF